MFYAQFIAIALVAFALGIPAMNKLTGSDEIRGVTVNSPDYYGLIYGER